MPEPLDSMVAPSSAKSSPLAVLNTHFAANLGLGIAIVAGFTHIMADLVTHNAITLPLWIEIVLNDLDVYLSPIGVSATILAYLGRPKTVPS